MGTFMYVLRVESVDPCKCFEVLLNFTVSKLVKFSAFILPGVLVLGLELLFNLLFTLFFLIIIILSYNSFTN